MKKPDRIRTAADTGDRSVRQPAERIDALLARLAPDDVLQLADQERVRMRPDGRAEQVVASLGIAHPVPECLVYRGSQSLIATVDRDHFGAELMHAIDIGRLTGDIDGAHVDPTRDTYPGTGSGGRDAVLARSSLCYDTLRTEMTREQGLPDGIVDLVRAGMRKILALEVDFAAPQLTEPVRSRQ